MNMKKIKTEQEAMSVIDEMHELIKTAKAEKKDAEIEYYIIGEEIARQFEQLPFDKRFNFGKPYISQGWEIGQKCFAGVNLVPTYGLTFSVDFRWEDAECNTPRVWINPSGYVIPYKGTFLGYNFEQRGKISLYDFIDTPNWRYLDNFTVKAPNLIGSMTPKKMEEWYQYTIEQKKFSDSVIASIAEKKRAFLDLYENIPDVVWHNKTHTSGSIKRNGIQHVFSYNDETGDIETENRLVAFDRSLDAFFKLASGTFGK